MRNRLAIQWQMIGRRHYRFIEQLMEAGLYDLAAQSQKISADAHERMTYYLLRSIHGSLDNQ